LFRAEKLYGCDFHYSNTPLLQLLWKPLVQALKDAQAGMQFKHDKKLAKTERAAVRKK
jgi:hypothetical protein